MLCGRLWMRMCVCICVCLCAACFNFFISNDHNYLDIGQSDVLTFFFDIQNKLYNVMLFITSYRLSLFLSSFFLPYRPALAFYSLLSSRCVCVCVCLCVCDVADVVSGVYRSVVCVCVCVCVCVR